MLFDDLSCHCCCCWSWLNSSWVFCISCRDLFSLRVCIFYISFGTHYIDIHPWSSHKLRGLNWVSKNCRPLHDVEILPGCTDKDPKDTPNRVFNKLAWHQNYDGTEGVQVNLSVSFMCKVYTILQYHPCLLPFSFFHLVCTGHATISWR